MSSISLRDCCMRRVVWTHALHLREPLTETTTTRNLGISFSLFLRSVFKNELSSRFHWCSRSWRKLGLLFRPCHRSVSQNESRSKFLWCPRPPVPSVRVPERIVEQISVVPQTTEKSGLMIQPVRCGSQNESWSVLRR